jgi:hypothetical protein
MVLGSGKGNKCCMLRVLETESPNIAQEGLEITVKPSLDRNKMFEQIRD